MNRAGLAIGLALALLPLASAWAQWQGSVGAGLRQVRLLERDPQGRQLVREHGLLPGVQASATYQAGDWRLGLRGDLYQGSVGYQGQSQGGASLVSNTGTSQRRIGLSADSALTEHTHLLGALEHDHWRRRIEGRGATLGLSERYQSWRLLAGARTRLLTHPRASLHAGAMLVLAQPERLTVKFGGQVYDDVNLETRSARGLRLVLGLQPASMPKVALNLEFDTLRIGRSAAATLLTNGLPVGTVAQPDHLRQALGLSLNYSF